MAALTLVAPHTLYARLEQVELIASTIEALDDTGEMSADVVEDLQHALITAIAGTREKVDHCAGALAAFEAARDAADREAQRLLERKRYMQRQYDRLARYVMVVLDASRLTKLEGLTSTLSLRNNPPAVAIADGAELPARFLRQPPPPPPEPDKGAIKLALKAGEVVPGCTLVQGQRLVRS